MATEPRPQRRRCQFPVVRGQVDQADLVREQMFDFSRAIVIGNEFRHPLRQSAEKWLGERVLPGRYFGISWDESDLITFRNRAIRDGALPKAAEFGAEWALFIDNDVTITHPGFEHFLATEGDVVSCRCRMRTSVPWACIDSFHTTFWFARIKVFRELRPQRPEAETFMLCIT